MISWSSLSAGLLPRFLSRSASSTTIDIPPVTVHDLNATSDKRAKTLNTLLKANHVNYSVLFHGNQFHNHTPHILGSSYILSSHEAQLKSIYDSQVSSLEPWQPSPSEITKDDWREYLGKKTYQRAYLDYFEDRLVGLGYDWKALVQEVLTTGDQPLLHDAFCGLAHPIIHLGYAYELDSRTVATEALTLWSSCYGAKHKYLDDPSYTRPAKDPSTDLHELIDRLHNDSRVEKSFANSGDDLELTETNADQEELLIEYWNSWTIKDPKSAFEHSQRFVAGLLVGSAAKGYDFFLVHLLTSSHALRILLPVFEDKWHVPLLRQWWLFVISTYIVRSRPAVDLSRVKEYEIGDRGWKDVLHAAVNGKWNLDEHFVKACRALKECAEVWGDNEGFFLRAALRLVDEFDEWRH